MKMLADGHATGNTYQIVQASLNIGLIVFLIAAVVVILSEAITRWVNGPARIEG